MRSHEMGRSVVSRVIRFWLVPVVSSSREDNLVRVVGRGWTRNWPEWLRTVTNPGGVSWAWAVNQTKLSRRHSHPPPKTPRRRGAKHDLLSSLRSGWTAGASSGFAFWLRNIQVFAGFGLLVLVSDFAAAGLLSELEELEELLLEAEESFFAASLYFSLR